MPGPPVARQTIGRVRLDVHAAQVHRHDAAAGAAFVADEAQVLPVFELADETFRFVAARLLIESIQKLLAGGGPCEGGTVEERAAEAAEVEQTFGSAVE